MSNYEPRRKTTTTINTHTYTVQTEAQGEEQKLREKQTHQQLNELHELCAYRRAIAKMNGFRTC